MILKKLILNPFAGIGNRTFEYKPGINIFLGRNEAGKSTMVKAIHSLFFVKPGKKVSEKKLYEEYLPVGGGDTIKAQLEFKVKEQECVISKNWGETNKSELRMPGGILLTKYEEIEKKIKSFLGLSKLTYENVLFVNQSKLTMTISDINLTEVKDDLINILSSAVFETGGISIQKFRELINKKESEYFNSWDRNSKKPKGNRDIENPWLKNVGFILDAYYKYRNLEKEHREIVEYGIKIDDYNKEINELTAKRDELDGFVKANKKSYEDNSKRELLETKIKSYTDTIKDVTEAQKLLPKLQSDNEHLNRELEKFQEEINKLNDERKQVIAVEEKKHLAEKYTKVNKLNSELEERKKLLDTITKVTSEDIKKCNKLKQKAESYRNKLEAQKLNASITAKNPITGEITLGTETPKTIKLENGEEYKDSAEGKFIFENESLKIEVTSGNENIDDILNKLAKTEKEIAELLESFKAGNIEELTEFEGKYRKQQSEVNRIEERIKEELEDKTIEELKAIYEEVQAVKIVKSSNEISDEIIEVSTKSAKIEEQRKTNSNQIKIYEDKYGNTGKLIDKLVELKSEENKLKAELSGLSPLPEGFSSAGEFIKHYDKAKNDFDNVKDELHNLSIEKKEFEKKEPESTQKEVYEELEEAKKEYHKKTEEGEAVLLIKSEVENTLSALNSDSYKPLKDSLKKYVSSTFDTENSDLKLEELKIKSLTRDNNEIPAELLSTGTKDIIGLALRLAMAEFYLKEKEGFMIMDDPLVNLDPDRQVKAVGLIKEFAKEKQILIMTCQPANAELFGETIIEV